MPNFLRFHSVLLEGYLAGSVFLNSAHAQTASAPKPPAKKSTATTAKKPATAAKSSKAAIPAVTTEKEKLSYALGSDMGKRLKASNVDVDPAVLERGMRDALTGAKPLMSEDEIRATISGAQKDLQQKQMAVAKEMGDKNKKEGDTFLAENKGKEGVVTLPSGLQYKVVKSGDGPKPTPTDTVVCNYRGTLISGKEFDSSYARNQPTTFPVNRVIKGWTEALQLMPVGSKWQLFIPPDLAYGERGAMPEIGPNATLIFEVELLSIQGKDAAKPEAK